MISIYLSVCLSVYLILSYPIPFHPIPSHLISSYLISSVYLSISISLSIYIPMHILHILVVAFVGGSGAKSWSWSPQFLGGWSARSPRQIWSGIPLGGGLSETDLNQLVILLHSY